MLGLIVHHILKAKRLGPVLIALTPVIDAVLLTTTSGHLRSGADVELAHGLSTLYLGLSIAQGQRMVRWADNRFSPVLKRSLPKAPLRNRLHLDLLEGRRAHPARSNTLRCHPVRPDLASGQRQPNGHA